MGRTNFKYGFEQKLAATLGELQLTETEVARVESLAATLSSFRNKARDLHELVGHLSAILKNVDPEWTPENGPKPVVPKCTRLPRRWVTLRAGL